MPQPDPGRGVEAETEEEAQGLHVPAPRDGAEEGTEEAGKRPAVGKQQVQISLIYATAMLHATEAAPNPAEDVVVIGTLGGSWIVYRWLRYDELLS